MIKVVTIDFWNTIVDSSNAGKRKDFRNAALESAFSSIGKPFDSSVADKAFEIAHAAFERRWRDEHKTMGADELLGIIWETMNVEVPSDIHESVVEAFKDSILVGVPQLVSGAEMVIPALAQRYKLSIISDTALSPGVLLKKVLAEHGLLEYFSHFVFSDEIGVSKPHINTFRSALDAFSVEAHEAVHIGDIERTDVAGAKNAGMRAILFHGDTSSRSFKSYKGETTADVRATHWLEVPPIIESWNESAANEQERVAS
jgi:putative hydrolase of the HAD superfamily